MTIRLNFTFNEYLRLSYSLALKRRAIIIVLALTVINVLCCILQMNGTDVGYGDYELVLWISLGTLIAVVFAIYRIAQNRYYANYGNGKEIFYEFTPDEMIVRATGYSTQVSWSQVQKVVQLKNWILIYTHNNPMPSSVHKRSFSDEQLAGFYDIVSGKNHIN